MRIYFPPRPRGFKPDDGLKPFPALETREVEYDPEAAHRAMRVLHRCKVENIEPKAIVTGYRAYFSILADSIRATQNPRTFSMVSDSSSAPLVLDGVNVFMDPFTHCDTITAAFGPEGFQFRKADT